MRWFFKKVWRGLKQGVGRRLGGMTKPSTVQLFTIYGQIKELRARLNFR